MSKMGYKVGDYLICESANRPKAFKVTAIDNRYYDLGIYGKFYKDQEGLRIATREELAKQKIYLELNWLIYI